MNWISNLFDTSGFPERWHCGEWSAVLGWTHIISDAAIFAAYVAIPCALVFFLRKRKDLPYPWVFVLFAAFILCCGTGHLLESIIFYEPVYRLAGLWKAVTAIVSWATVIVLLPLIPKILALRSPRELQEEVDRRAIVEKNLRKTNEELEQFAYIASHDLKSPIRAIRMTAEFLREDLDDREAVERHIDALQSRADRMQGLVAGLLDMALAGNDIHDVETVDPVELLGGVVGAMSDDVRPRIRTEGDVFPIVTNRLALEQVLANLIGNGLKHSRSDESAVLVRVSSDDDRPGFVRFSVEDDGPGIEPEYRERIFGLFQTLRARDEFESTGIGLTIVKKLVDRVGASIRVEDSDLGGAAFVVSWPARLNIEPATLGGSRDAVASGTERLAETVN